VADVQSGEPDPIPWYEESWAVVTAGVAGVLVIGVLIYAVMQTSEHSVDPSNGPQYFTDYPTSSTTSSSRTTTSRTTRSSTTTTTTTTTSDTETSDTETSDTETETETETTTSTTLDDENPFILNPFATTTTTTTDGDDG
jgi:cytoskeletal protein RodZ